MTMDYEKEDDKRMPLLETGVIVEMDENEDDEKYVEPWIRWFRCYVFASTALVLLALVPSAWYRSGELVHKTMTVPNHAYDHIGLFTAAAGSDGATVDVWCGYDNIYKSPIRLLMIANFFFAVLWVLQIMLTDMIMSNLEDTETTAKATTATTTFLVQKHQERFGVFAIFKLLVISTVFQFKPMDIFILFLWYTWMSLLRSLSSLSAAVIAASHKQQDHIAAVEATHLLRLLLAVNILLTAGFYSAIHRSCTSFILLVTADAVVTGLYIIRHLIHQRVLATTTGNGDDKTVIYLENTETTARHPSVDKESRSSAAYGNPWICCLDLLRFLVEIMHYQQIWLMRGLHLDLVTLLVGLRLHLLFCCLFAQAKKDGGKAYGEGEGDGEEEDGNTSHHPGLGPMISCPGKLAANLGLTCGASSFHCNRAIAATQDDDDEAEEETHG